MIQLQLQRVNYKIRDCVRGMCTSNRRELQEEWRNEVELGIKLPPITLCGLEGKLSPFIQ